MNISVYNDENDTSASSTTTYSINISNAYKNLLCQMPEVGEPNYLLSTTKYFVLLCHHNGVNELAL